MSAPRAHSSPGRSRGQCVEWYDSEFVGVRGELLLDLEPPRPNDAEGAFVEALASARDQHARSFELRAATSLARLWQSGEQRQEAHDLLAGVYDRFTEGFETSDLRDAAALLAELAEPAPLHPRACS